MLCEFENAPHAPGYDAFLIRVIALIGRANLLEPVGAATG